MAGVRIGLKDLFYAKLLEDTTGAISYDTPTRLSKALTATITPTVNSATLFADDGPDETATSIGGIAAQFGIKDFTLDVQADVLGKQIANGVLIDSTSDVAPYVAVGFRSLKSDGSYRYVWLLKGKFSIPEDSYATKGDTPTFQTPTITANFVTRDYDGHWRLTGDDDQADFDGDTWFDAVPNVSGDTTPPTLTTLPANNATAVVVSAPMRWTFSKALAESSVVPANFIVQKADGSGAVAGSLSLDGTKKIVTFSPAANLTAATAYLALAGVGVKDQAGNALAAPSITKFTTA